MALPHVLRRAGAGDPRSRRPARRLRAVRLRHRFRHRARAVSHASTSAARRRCTRSRRSCARDRDRVLLAAESAGRRELLLDLLRPYGIDSQGRRQLAGVPRLDRRAHRAGRRPARLRRHAARARGHDLRRGTAVRRARAPGAAPAPHPTAIPAKIIQQLADLRPGAPVVHEDYGVGRYTGLTTMDAGGMTAEFLVLEYAERRQAVRAGAGARAHQPLHRRARRDGPAAQARRRPVDQGAGARGREDPRRRGRAARRLRAPRRPPGPRVRRSTTSSCARSRPGFPFEETVDQLSAIQAVVDDLRSGKPMDRVVCGDVGFGKTEVALRAAFVAVQGGKQVAVLVPTTLLAQQHYETFADRFADWPFKIELLSRFRAGAQSKAALDGLARRQGRHRRRHAPPAAARRQVQGPRPGDHRRGAPFRRARQGTPEVAARRGRRADADRHADPAHAQHGARRAARPVADHDAAGRAAVDQDVREPSGATRPCARPACASCAAAARCTSSTTASRRSRRRRSSWRSSCRRRAS